jgi:hypothetical protein
MFTLHPKFIVINKINFVKQKPTNLILFKLKSKILKNYQLKTKAIKITK